MAAGDASFACMAVPVETTARSRGATWIWTTGRPGLSQTLAWIGPQRAQVRERVEAGRVTALERDLKRILTDEGDVLDAELFGAERLDPGQAPGGTGLTATFSARTRPSQLLGCVLRVLAVLPRDCLLHTSD